MKKLKIYLDTNIYIKIINHEKDHDYALSKINNLYKKGLAIFPHSPAHAEEVITRKTEDEIKKMQKLVSKFDNDYGYTPGVPSLEEMILNVSYVSSNTAILNCYIEQYLTILRKKLLGFKYSKSTTLIKEKFSERIEKAKRLISGISGEDITKFSINNDINLMGRRTKESLKENFEKINLPQEGVKTFQEIHKRYNLGPRRLANIHPDKIFEDKSLLAFTVNELSETNLGTTENITDINQFKKGAALLDSYRDLMFAVEFLLNSLEKAGYFHEENNNELSLSGRMHDVSHAIYAANANYLVTDDKRLSKKTSAVYNYLGIETKIITSDDFIHNSLN